MPDPFVPGWHPDDEKRSRDAWFATGVMPLLKTPFEADDTPIPKAFSLSSRLLWPRNQGPVGSCFINAGVSAQEISTTCSVEAGENIEEHQLSRWFGWYETRLRDGLSGSRQDGGTISGVYRAGHEVGFALEADAPYRPENRYLNQKPPAKAYESAKSSKIVAFASIGQRDRKARQKQILNGYPCNPGIWWPYGWDTACDKYGRTTGVGSGTYGHALVIMGWIEDWDGHFWWEYLNSHGAIYGAPPADVQQEIIGYRPFPTKSGRQYSFWVRDDHEAAVMSKGNVELLSASGVTGFKAKDLVSRRNAMS